MSSLTAGESPDTHTWRRVLGVYDAGIAGPSLLSVGGVHGNEPAGVYALLRVLEGLRAGAIPLKGRLVAAAGNLTALAAGQRFIDRDLNRAWLPADVESRKSRGPAPCVEDREQLELLELMERIEGEARGPLMFVDLHTSSSAGGSFSCLSDTLANRRIALALPVPMILGLEECIDGAIMEWFNQRSAVAIAVEGGMHADPASVDNLEAALWLALHAGGMLPPGHVDLDAHGATLRRSANGLPQVLEILHREHIDPEDEFVMEPGFSSFDEIAKGQLLATRNGVDRSAPWTCRILLPLYQGQGEDGYFLVREVGVFWLRLAAWLRWLRVQAIAHWLPGVRRDSGSVDTLVVSPRVARFLVVPFFHLLGYRRRRVVDGMLRFSRRPDPAL